MNFFRGLMSVSFIYLIFWLTYNIGFMRGHGDAMNDKGYRFDKTARAFP